MTPDQMKGLFWELVGLTSSYARAPGSGTPAGPDVIGMIWGAFVEMARFARPQRLRKYDTITLVAGTERYSKPSGWMDWYGVEDDITIAGLPVKPVPRGEVEQWRDGGSTPVGSSPLVYYEAGGQDVSPFADQIGFYPVPSEAGTAKCHFLRYPIKLDASGMTGSTEYPDIPPDFHKAAVYYAVWDFYQRRKEITTKDITFLLSYYQSKLPALKSATAEHLRPNAHRTTANSVRANLEAWD